MENRRAVLDRLKWLHQSAIFRVGLQTIESAENGAARDDAFLLGRLLPRATLSARRLFLVDGQHARCFVFQIDTVNSSARVSPPAMPL